MTTITADDLIFAPVNQPFPLFSIGPVKPVSTAVSSLKVTPKKLRPQAVKCYALTLEEYLDDHGYASEEDMLFDLFLESVIPAMCKSACSVEPDGFCPHDCPSPLLDRLL